MMKQLLIAGLLAAPFHLKAQSDEIKADVVSVVQDLFDGMRKGDSTMVRTVFDPTARLQTLLFDKKGKPAIQSESVSGFVAAVGTPHDQVWDERIWSYDVKIDGNLATVWTDYTFFLGEKMSHCGVNAFQLFFNGEDWKITQITDTRRKDDCQTAPNSNESAIHQLLDNWHQAAATADEEVFFNSMTADAVYLGTDASERWLRDELKEWSAKYFAKESAWAFKPHDRHIYFTNDNSTAWFDEKLDTWMGACRGSGVLHKTPQGWKIKHYNLAVAVPNETINGYIELLKKVPSKND